MSILAFAFEEKQVRFINGEPIGVDVAKVLGYADPSSAVRDRVSPKNKRVVDLPPIGIDGIPSRIKKITTLLEAGIYQLIFSSKLPSAQKFQDWVFEEVLPSIRKTGKYAVSEYKLPQNYIEALEELLVSKKNEAKLEAENQKLLPYKKLFNDFFASEKSLNMNMLSALLRNLGFKNLGSKKLHKVFRDHNVFSKREGEDKNRPLDRHQNAGLFEYIPYSKLNDEQSTQRPRNGQTHQARIFPKGVLWLLKQEWFLAYADDKEQTLEIIAVLNQLFA